METRAGLRAADRPRVVTMATVRLLHSQVTPSVPRCLQRRGARDQLQCAGSSKSVQQQLLEGRLQLAYRHGAHALLQCMCLRMSFLYLQGPETSAGNAL